VSLPCSLFCAPPERDGFSEQRRPLMNTPMRSHTLNVLGLEVSFKAEADPKRIERANALLEKRYSQLTQHRGHISKEKLLTFLALALADDILQAREEKNETKSRMERLLSSMEKVTS
jgi:cell division protein ZapA